MVVRSPVWCVRARRIHAAKSRLSSPPLLALLCRFRLRGVAVCWIRFGVMSLVCEEPLLGCSTSLRGSVGVACSTLPCARTRYV
jgi:hypothetical protein